MIASNTWLACLIVIIISQVTSSTEQVISYRAISEFVDTDVRVRRQADETTTTPKPSVVNEDTTEYYSVKYVSPGELGEDSFWRELSSADEGVVKHVSLQDAHRLAVKISLDFPFLFYGETIRSVTIATGGFLYMSDFLHSFLTASQYVAPLMANFDTSIAGNTSEILYKTFSDAFIVQWSNVYLKGNETIGPFKFQAQLYKEGGKIITAYKNIPRAIDDISSDAHPVKVGLSDAYYWDNGPYRTIYPYHTVQAVKDRIVNDSAIIYTHLTTCNMLRSCDTCMNAQLTNRNFPFTCYWCSALNRCSSAFDRQRQDWITNGCIFNTTQTHCGHMFTTTTQPSVVSDKGKSDETPTWQPVTAAICTILGLSAAIVLGFIFYGYRNPESGVGQFMIRHRPSEMWRKFKSWKDKDSNDAGNMSSIG